MGSSTLYTLEKYIMEFMACSMVSFITGRLACSACGETLWWSEGGEEGRGEAGEDR